MTDPSKWKIHSERVIDDTRRAEQVLMLRRHRFIVDRWVWELPGGYLNPGEDPVACAAREVEEETGWRPGAMELLMSFQPAVGTIGQDNLVYLARGAGSVAGLYAVLLRRATGKL